MCGNHWMKVLKHATLLVSNGIFCYRSSFPTEFILFAVAYSKVSYVAGVKLFNKSKCQCHWTEEEVCHICCIFKPLLVVRSDCTGYMTAHWSILPFYAHFINELCMHNTYMLYVSGYLCGLILCFITLNFRELTICSAFSVFVIDWGQKLSKVWNPVSMSDAYLFLKTYKIPVI
jgi:hypothetical protein